MAIRLYRSGGGIFCQNPSLFLMPIIAILVLGRLRKQAILKRGAEQIWELHRWIIN
jgi:hypothetical protein